MIDLTREIVADGKEHTFTINFPLYHDVYELYVGLKEGSTILKAPDYSVKVPMVFYGSSVTQGGCASRPGTCYQAYLSRWFDADYINLGFSGNGKAEDEMIEYLAGLEMAAFVSDYDHNAPNAEHLLKTHEKLYREIRKKHPDLWALLLKWDADSPVTFKPDGHTVHDFDERFALEDQGLITPSDPWKWSYLTDRPLQLKMIF